MNKKIIYGGIKIKNILSGLRISFHISNTSTWLRWSDSSRSIANLMFSKTNLSDKYWQPLSSEFKVRMQP